MSLTVSGRFYPGFYRGLDGNGMVPATITAPGTRSSDPVLNSRDTTP